MTDTAALRAAAQAATPSLSPDELRRLLIAANHDLEEIDGLSKRLRTYIEGIEALLETGYFSEITNATD